MKYSNTRVAKYSRSRYKVLKAQHRCTRCGGKDERTLAGKTTCAKCNERNMAGARRRAAEKAALEDRGCEYCNGEDLIFNGRTRTGKKRLEYVGIDIYILDNELVVNCIPDTIEDRSMDAKVRIKYCPICGRKFKKV